MAPNTDFLITISIAQQQLFAPFQPLWAASRRDGALQIAFGLSRKEFTGMVEKRFPPAEFILSHAPHPALAQIGEYLHGKRRSFNVPLDLARLTPFQQQVYQAVIDIPYGETRTYGQIAHQIGKPDAARAVGTANGANPMPILIPCHRLVGADGSLRGYGGAGGIATKQWLLDLEQKATEF